MNLPLFNTEVSQHIPPILVRGKDPLDRCWRRPDSLLTIGRGFVCVFPQDQPRPIWVFSSNVQHHPTNQEVGPALTDR